MDLLAKYFSDTSPGGLYPGLSDDAYNSICRGRHSAIIHGYNPWEFLDRAVNPKKWALKLDPYKSHFHAVRLLSGEVLPFWYTLPAGFDRKTEARRQEHDALLEQYNGRVIRYEDHQDNLARLASLEASPIWQSIWENRLDTELTATGFCPWTELPWKVKLDLPMRKEWGILWDLKLLDMPKEMRAWPRALEYKVDDYNYDSQLAMYQIVGNQHDLGFQQCGLIVVEDAYPHRVEFFTYSEKILERGREKLERSMRTLALCLKANQWPRIDGQQIKLIGERL